MQQNLLVTPDKALGVVPVGHAATVYNQDEVVESNLDPGVEMGPNKWNKSKNEVYGVTVNGTSAGQQAQAADYARSQLRKPYNKNFYRMDYRDKFYCSQLVRSAYLDLFNIDLNTDEFDIIAGGKSMAKAIHPLELINPANTTIIYRK